MKLWLAKRRRDDKVGLVPTDDTSRAALARLGDGECVEVEIVRPRSLQWHRMYFGICRSIGENQDPPRDENSIDHELRVRAGHYDVMWVDGHECRVPKRIAFARLTADEWAELWPSLDLAIREHFGDEYIGESQRTGTW
jgi:hypothetical protein